MDKQNNKINKSVMMLILKWYTIIHTTYTKKKHNTLNMGIKDSNKKIRANKMILYIIQEIKFHDY